LAEEFLTLAEHQDDPVLKQTGHRALGQALFLIGELAPARDHLGNSLDLLRISLMVSGDFGAS